METGLYEIARVSTFQHRDCQFLSIQLTE